MNAERKKKYRISYKIYRKGKTKERRIMRLHKIR